MTQGLFGAFPAALHDDVAAALTVVPPVQFPPINPFNVVVRGESITIPARIYNAVPGPVAESRLSSTQLAVLDCLYSRHGDGYIRHECVARIARSTQDWAAPFVVELVGEYVLEIVREIGSALTELTAERSAQFALYGKYVAANPRRFSLVQRRVVSYWSCYYREEFPQYRTYPAAQLVEALRVAGNSFADTKLPYLGPVAGRETPQRVR